MSVVEPRIKSPDELRETPPSSGRETGNRPALTFGAVLLVWCAILLSFRGHVALVLQAWETLPSHSHGYVVLLVVAYLLWTKRPQLQEVSCRPSWKGFAFLNLLGFAALLGDMVSVAGVVQFSVVFMLFGAVWAVAGDRAARLCMGPLSFMLFAVPFGHEILPTLMNWTADATVVALRESGVPVYQEGRNFVIPSGRWSVVEACGGIRYLLTSIFIGAVFAYLTYTRPLKRVLFMVWAVIMPLFANWIRAYVIVMVAHLTGNEWGLGLSHLALGWLIFGVAIFASFAVGTRWRDPVPVSPPMAPGERATLGRIASAALVAALMPYGWQLASAGLEVRGSAAAPALALASLSGLERAEGPTDKVQPVYPGARMTYQATYLFKGEPIDVFVAYYRNQAQGAELISVLNKIEPTGDWSWSVSANAERAGPTLPPTRLEGYSRNGKHAALHHLYWVGGSTTTSDLGSKLLQVWSRLRGQGDDAAFVALTAYSAESVEQASRRVQDFAATHLERLLGDLDRAAQDGQGGQ
ncbi:exosortase A [Zoogloea dura]|uniref:Exosortase A n=1 Tax=Zoogloea dura TaxID=2728840 RepID=A0A848FYT4_9RHOO|nr:exosortase A [Zoogloea dura]NML24192.1 exosortase A [Zoogloea dura]